MSETGKKQSFLHGAAWLALAVAVVKVIGALYKFPLQMIIGDEGYSYFTTAYDVYSVLMTVATAGLPLALSRMTSAANALGHDRQVRRIFKAGRFIYLALGLLGSLAMFLLCRNEYMTQRQPDAWAAIAVLGPCALLMGIISTYRGFFQGHFAAVRAVDAGEQADGSGFSRAVRAYQTVDTALGDGHSQIVQGFYISKGLRHMLLS